MCSRYAETQCCVCRRYLDQSCNRIIVEICGHQKCRECFIKEEDGCSICAQNKQQFGVESESSSHRNSYEVIPSGNESATIVADGAIEPVVEISEEVSHIVTINESEGDVRYKCLICEKSFKSRNNRKYHLFCDKSRSKPFQCDRCDKQFITLAHMNYHQNTHDTDKQFTCSHCQKVYSGPMALRKHMKKHQSECHLFNFHWMFYFPKIGFFFSFCHGIVNIIVFTSISIPRLIDIIQFQMNSNTNVRSAMKNSCTKSS